MDRSSSMQQSKSTLVEESSLCKLDELSTDELLAMLDFGHLSSLEELPVDSSSYITPYKDK
ncbi:hypothetical protein CRYUN_Cryun08bG0079800 [Craigia yunnanensis]